MVGVAAGAAGSAAVAMAAESKRPLTIASTEEQRISEFIP
jgi:hypothetical protein